MNLIKRQHGKGTFGLCKRRVKI
ncbi:hypothetical protein NC652_006388 [Populus alba x Populus x berolinensis]|uniref:Uncharacterized protein n=1 Tax=Populus alba x Populus x berolinensis TaxID=444605 RepID=A0AAD6RDZ3_9ROSI|nr:hypothetical protein NC651_006106 [Populus alba x Populus x berolinensis]KAJ6954927.1 hypothetical protein NC652_006388 [Populus alba x Populus x berolinensis]KAJ7007200.1 hypothetical protein NC653_006295 [Populus alba x Populus x berolinensis]